MKKILGLWDTKNKNISLGGLILLSVMLKAKAFIQDSSIEGVCFILDDFGKEDKKIVKMTEAECERSIYFSTLLKFEGIKACYKAKTKFAIEQFVCENPDWDFFPSVFDLHSKSFRHNMYESTILLQQFFSEHKFIPYFKMDTTSIKWAANFIAKNVLPSLPMVVHLKNNLFQKNCSNVNVDEWLIFFRMCNTYNVKFILIGNEEIDRRIAELPNVLITKQMGVTLAQELALIEIAYAFMGMSSGPCNAAIYSEIPYVIYKNPDHDAKAMELELGTNDQFPFALPYQKVLRIFETSKNIFLNFEFILSNYDCNIWKSRISYIVEGAQS